MRAAPIPTPPPPTLIPTRAVCDRIWQEHHSQLLPVETSIDELHSAFPAWLKQLREHDPTTAPSVNEWLGLLEPSDATPLKAAMKELVQLYVFTTVCDPPMKFDVGTVGNRAKFESASAASLDDKIKAGKECVVICPALYSADGMLKAKAKVLAFDYLC